jgi:hypothetical protein
MKATLRSFVLLCSGFTLLATLSARAELMYATNGSSISRFDSNSLGSVTTVPLTGLQTNETLVGIDLRPSNGLLYGVGSTSRVYTINPLTGAATPVGASQFSPLLNGTSFGTDFNPVPDRIRQVSNTEQNLRLNPDTGATAATDTALNPAGNVVAVAYDRNFAGTTLTTLFGIDSAAGTLVRIGGVDGTPSPNGGLITTIGSLNLGTNLNEAIGFDISGLSAIAFASITIGNVSSLYTINLATGVASLASSNGGVIGTGTTAFLGLTAATAVPEPGSVALIATAAGLLGLYRFRSRKKN